MTEAEYSVLFQQWLPVFRGFADAPAAQIVVPELDCPLYRPDFVQVDLWDSVGDVSPDAWAVLAEALAARVYTIARSKPGITVRQLGERLQYTEPYLRQSVRALLRCGWLRAGGLSGSGLWVDTRLPRFRIVAFELKAGHWRAAARQLAGYSHYADRVVLVVRPFGAPAVASAALSDADLHRLSVVAFDPNDGPRFMRWRLRTPRRPEWRVQVLAKAVVKECSSSRR